MTVKLFFDSEGQDVIGWPEFHYDEETVVNPFVNDDLNTLVRDRAREYAVKQRKTLSLLVIEAFIQ